MVGDYSFELTKRARNIIIQGMKDGVGQGELVTLMREDLAEYTDRWLETVIRTKTTEIYNDARKSFWDNDEFSNQVIEAYQFSAILDDRTTDVCRDLDGAIFERGEYLNRITPPLHFNCRSLLVPVTRFEPYKEDPGYYKKGEEPDLTDLRSSGGGLIATKKDYHIHKKVETPAEEKKDHKIVRIEKVVKRDEYGKVIGMTETPIYE